MHKIVGYDGGVSAARPGKKSASNKVDLFGNGHTSYRRLVLIQQFDKSTRIKIWIGVIALSIIIAYVMSAVIDRDFLAAAYHVITGRDSGVESVGGMFLSRLSPANFTRIRFIRMEVMAIAFFVFLMHPIYGIPTLYEFVYDKRWLLAMLLLLFFILNGLNGDSITCYDYYIQNGQGSQFIYPIIGKEREIRSDEWLVATPQILYGVMKKGGLSFPSLFELFSNPLTLIYWIIYKIFGARSYYSAFWYTPIFLGGLLTAEFLQILLAGDPSDERGIGEVTAAQKLLVSASGFMIFLSSFYQWWAFPAYFFYIHGAVVFLWYFFHQNKLWKKALLLYVTGVLVISYLKLLYPAWQVSFGYVAVVLVLWVLYEHRTQIKYFEKKEWGLFIAAIAVVAAAAGYFVSKNWDYFVTMFNTVYPGDRADAGGMSIPKLFNYIPGLIFAFRGEFQASEAGTIISLFPLPTILILYKWHRQKHLTFLETGLLIVTAILSIYCTTGLPMPIAFITLLSRSTAWRAVDVIGYINVLFFVLALKDYAGESIPEVASSRHRQKQLSGKWKIYKTAMVLIITADIITGMFVRPIEYGFEAISSKPLFDEIQKLKEDPECRILAYDSIILPSYTTACGADTVNFVNIRPNLPLYKKLDKQGKYEDIYNRYAHVKMVFTKKKHTRFELDQKDAITVRLTAKDIALTGATYVVSSKKLSMDNRWLSLDEIYHEGGIYIYGIKYTERSYKRYIENNSNGLMFLREQGYIE